jgi:hypothetical protein
MESSKVLVLGGTFLIVVIVAGAFLFTTAPFGFVGKFTDVTGADTDSRIDMYQHKDQPFADTVRMTGDRPYYDMKGNAVAANLDDLAEGNLRNPIIYDEFGMKVPDSTRVWTGTQEKGFKKEKTQKALPQCYDWTRSASTHLGGYGVASSTNLMWTDAGVANCNSEFRIYCIQDG